VAQNGAGANGEHGSHAAAIHGKAAMAHRIDAAVHHVEPAAAESPIDSALAQAGVDELSPRDHAVLALSNCRDHAVHETNIAFTAV
jgi:hypothetical protein